METRNYKVDSDRVLIDTGNRDMEFRLSKDGLAGPLGIQTGQLTEGARG